jgi:hypothetical protein
MKSTLWRVFVIKSYTLAHFLFVILLLASCGAKKNSSRSLDDTKSFIKATQTAQNCSKIDSNALVLKSRELISQIDQFTFASGRQFIIEANRYLLENGSQFSPLILGEREINKAYSSLESKFAQIKMTASATKEWTDLIQSKDFLNNIVNRWAFHQCHLPKLVDNLDQELSDFLSMESQFCKKDCIANSDARLIESDEAQIRKKVISMCSIAERKSKCSVDYDYAKLISQDKRYIQSVLDLVRPHFNQILFEPTKAGVDILCKKNEDKFELTFPIKKSSNHYEVTNSISRYWSNEDIKVSFYENDRGLEVINSNESVSYVSSDRPYAISISNSVVGLNRVKTIAHEFGHILGFRDCYIEYFNAKNDEVVYFELEREKGNLMCSLVTGDKIPDKYKESLVQKYCD